MGAVQSSSSENGVIWREHKKPVHACCVSMDGTMLLSCSGDKTLKLWSLNDFTFLRQFDGHASPVYSCSFSWDGKFAISGSLDGEVKVWDVSLGKELYTLQEHKQAVMDVKFHPTKVQAISASADKSLLVWEFFEDESSAEQSMTSRRIALTGHRNAVNSIAVTSDGQSIISGSSDNSVKVWSTKTMKDVKTFSGHKDAVMSVDVNLDGTLIISSSQDYSVRIWSFESGKVMRVLTGHVDAVRCCKFSLDGTMILSGSFDKNLIAWVMAEDSDDWERACIFKGGHSRGITTCSFSPDGMVAISGSWDGSVHLWPMEDIRLHAAFQRQGDGNGEKEGDSGPGGEDGKVEFNLPSTTTLPAIVADKSFEATRPSLHAVVAEMEKMVGVQRGKAKIGHLCKYYLRYWEHLGVRNRCLNMFLLGQQGTGKYHFAKLYARFLWASGFIKTDGFTQGSMNVSNTWERPTMRLSIGGHEDEHWPLILLRAPKLKGSSPESTANNFRNFLERHRGNVVLLKEIDSLADSVSVEVIKAVVQVIQRFLEEHGDGFTLLVSGRDRNSVGNIFRHYQPAKPTMLRRHFPFVMDFDRYSAEELMEIFRRQCDREQVRLGSTVTEVMLQKAFVLNFNFFDGSNGAGTRHLLMLARLEHGKRGDRREGIFEATDLQAAFQKLRQDWFAAHPERTFAALQYMQQTEKSMESRRRKSIGDDADAINDASAAGAEADLEEEEGESEDDWELQKWTLEDFRIFHDHELKKREEDHHRTLQREREECRMVVEQTNLAHAASLSRFLAALRQVIYQKFFHITGREAFQVWQFGTRRRHLRQHRRKIAQERWSRKVYSIALSEWKEWQRERRMRSRVLSSAVAARKYEAAKESFQLWNRFLWLSREEQRVKATGYERLLSSLVAKQDSFRNSILPDWSDAVNEQINDRELEWEFQRRDAKHADEMYKLTKRHQSEVSEWRKDSEAKLRRQKELRKESEKTLKPLQQWKWKATVFSSILVILYAAPIVPAVTPWVMSTMQQLSLGHWYVGILLVVSLGAAIRRLLKWLYVSVIPSNVKSAYRWARDMELDSHLVGVLIAYFSWLQLCDDGDQAQGQLFLRCKPRISWISKVVVAVSASVMTQEIKVLVAILHRQGIRNVIKATAAKLVPSWFYSLHDHSIPELLAVVQHSNVPPGKKVKACKRIAEFAEGGQERQEHIVHWDGIVILTDVIKSEQNLEVLEAAAEALANMCSSRVVVNSLLEKDGVKILINLLQREKKASITKQCLRCLAQIAESGFLGAEAVLSFPGSSQLITEVLSSRDVETRKQAAKMLSSLASSLFSKPLKDEGMHISKLQKDLRLMEMVQPLVSELQGGWFLRIICLLPDCKACAARSLGFLAGGSSDYVESMVRAGAVQALMKILRLRYRWLYPTESLLRLKADAAFAVAAIAREGDLQRGRLQEAGAIQVLEQLWMGMMHNIDGDVAVLMRDEALKALQAVRGTSNQGSVFRTPPLSGTSTPCISSRNSSPASSPRRRRVTDSAYLRQSL